MCHRLGFGDGLDLVISEYKYCICARCSRPGIALHYISKILTNCIVPCLFYIRVSIVGKALVFRNYYLPRLRMHHWGAEMLRDRQIDVLRGGNVEVFRNKVSSGVICTPALTKFTACWVMIQGVLKVGIGCHGVGVAGVPLACLCASETLSSAACVSPHFLFATSFGLLSSLTGELP